MSREVRFAMLILAVLTALFPSLAFGGHVPDPLPRTYAVGALRADDTAVELLLDPSFDIRAEVVLADGEEAGAQPGLAGTSRILEERADRIVLEAELDHPGTLVLLDGYDPAAPPEGP